MPISKMYIGECQNWPHFQPDAEGWETSCGYTIPSGAPLTYGENPQGNCGAPYGDYGWFSSTNSLTGSASLAVVWDGQHIFATSDWASADKGLDIYYDPGNHNSNLVYKKDVDGATGNYTGKIYQRYGAFTKIANGGWGVVAQNLCGTNIYSNTEIYVSCLRRTTFHHVCPTSLGSLAEARNPSAECGLPYSNGWFIRGDYQQLIITFDGQTVYNGLPPNPGSSTPAGTRITVNGYDYVRSPDPQCGFYMPVPTQYSGGWHNDGVTCGIAPHANAADGWAFAYTRYKTP